MYLLKLALRPWRAAPWSQSVTAVAVGLLLLLGGFLACFERGLEPVVQRLRGEQVITAYLDGSVEAAREAQIVDSIRIAVGAKAVEVNLVSTTQFIEELGKHYPDLAKELHELGDEARAVVPRHVVISGLLSGNALDGVKAVPGIESAESSKDRHRHIVGAFQALQWVAKLFIAGIALALLTGLVHLARTNAHLHRDALALLRLWGAGPLTLRIPGLLSGFWVGLLGGAIACAGWVAGGAWLARQIHALSPMLSEMPMPTHVGAVLLLAGALAGVAAGGFRADTRS